MADVSVIVATFGDPAWRARGDTASLSASAQTTRVEICQTHGASLCEARNKGARWVSGEWLIFLDADDTLDPHYAEEMLKGTADLRQPSTLGVYPDGSTDAAANIIPPRGNSIIDGNHLVIGTMVRRQMFIDVGGFNDLPVLEDWDLWVRCLLAGATQEAIPTAIYRVGVNDASRNAPGGLHNVTYWQIRSKYEAAARAARV